MDRRIVRENTFKILFQVEARSAEALDEIFEVFCAESGITKSRDLRILREKVEGAVAHLNEIDEYIERYSNGWKKNRIGKAELAILRNAVYEIVWEDIPGAIAANEAVELAKVYAQDKAPAFINGILAQVIASKKEA